MTHLDLLNRSLLVTLGCNADTADAIMERINDLEHSNSSLADEIKTLTAERTNLERWKKEMLEVGMWWNKIDEYVWATAHENGMRLGDSVAAHALKMIKSGHELTEEIRKLARTL